MSNKATLWTSDMSDWTQLDIEITPEIELKIKETVKNIDHTDLKKHPAVNTGQK